MTLVAGCLVQWMPHRIYGCVAAMENPRVTVQLDTGETRVFAADGGVLVRVPFELGSQVNRVGSSNVGIVAGPVPGSRPAWTVLFPGQPPTNIPECGLRPATIDDPVARMHAGMIGKARDFNLRSVAADLWFHHLHNELVSLAHARVELKPHQVGVAHRVITNYPHRFLLCDEVGLGKTIEAAMVIKELRARKQIGRVLILVPSGLQRQWQFELKTKFNEQFAIYNRDTISYLRNQGVSHPWSHHSNVISSHSWAAWSDERRAEIAAIDWDLVVVDEAHHARRQRYGRRVTRTQLHRLVEMLVAGTNQTRRAALFLTATPMQLQRHELYSLVDMLDAILFSSEADFVEHIEDLSGLNTLVDEFREHGPPSDPEKVEDWAAAVADILDWSEEDAVDLLESHDPDSIIDTLEGAHRLSEILIRTRRARVGGFQPRRAFRWPVAPTELELAIYEQLDRVLAQGFDVATRTKRTSVGFLMTIFQKLATSSSRALETSLRRKLAKAARASATSVAEAEEALESDTEASEVVEDLGPVPELDLSLISDLASLLARVERDSKAAVLVERLSELFADDPNEKVLIFTQFRETQEMIRELLQRNGWAAHIFHGQLKPLQKEDAVNAFRDGTGPQVMISTEAGGEGRNFQFCHILVNYDLPWNPMKVEQRIGRVDRIGQEHPVVVFNLFVEGTIEQRVLDVLEYRINLFEEAVGALEPILGDVENDIRKALLLAGDARNAALAKLAENTEDAVKQARLAEEQMADLILDTKSYGSGIARLVKGAEQPVTQEDYERFLGKLLASAGTYIERSRSEVGVHVVHFHAPFTVEHADLMDAGERRRVCFDADRHVDSELVEYMGFGHPIIDTLTDLRTDTWVDGMTAVRKIDRFPTSGWQFNWVVELEAVRSRSSLHPVFVDDEGTVHAGVGDGLLRLSRAFSREDAPAPIDAEVLDTAADAALEYIQEVVESLEHEARAAAEEAADTEERRIVAYHDQRRRAAGDKLQDVEETLRRMEQSDDPNDQRILPVWRANLERAQVELEQVDRDQDEMLADNQKRRNPSVSYRLLNVARILPDGQ